MASSEHPLHDPVPAQEATSESASRLPIPPEIDNDLPPSYEPPVTRPFRAEDYAKDGKKHLLLAASGSGATIKLPEIIKILASSTDISIRVVLTDAATRFLSGASEDNPTVESLKYLPHVEGVYNDADEWSEPLIRGSAILHIELRKWADLMVVAPLDANTLSKMAYGLSDNLLLSILRTWDPDARFNPPGREERPKRLVVAPAMNSAMWLHPATKQHFKILEDEWSEAKRFKKPSSFVPSPGLSQYSIRVVPWAKILKPTDEELAVDDIDMGLMISVRYIVAEILYQTKKYD